MRFYSKALDAGSEFYYVMEGTKAVTQATRLEYEKMVRVARDLSTQTIYNNIKIADAMKYMGMAGFNPGQINETIKAVTALGAATDYRIEGKGGTADYMTNIMTAFQLRANQSMRAADILAKATTASNVDLDDIHDALRYSAADLTSIGSSLEEATALIGVLGGAGIKGSMGGTAIGNMIQKLVKGMGEFRTARQSKILERLGLTKEDILDSKGNIKAIIDIIEDFRERVKAQPRADQLDLISGFFGRRGNRAFAALIKDSFLSLPMRELYDKILTESPGTALRIASQRIDTMKGDAMLLRDTWVEFQTSVSDAIEPIWRKVLQVTRKIVQALIWASKTPVGKTFLIIGGVLSVVATAAGALIVVISSIGLLLLTTEFSFKKLQMTGVWAWNKINAAMTNYRINLAATNAQMSYMGGGKFRSAKTGRFVSSKTVMGLPLPGFFTTIGSKFKKIFNVGGKGAKLFGARIGSVLPALRVFGGVMGRLTPLLFGWPGLIAGLAVSLLGFKRTLNIILFPLKLIGAILLGIAKMFQGYGFGRAFNFASDKIFGTNLEEHRRVRDAYNYKKGVEAFYPNGSAREAYDLSPNGNNAKNTINSLDLYDRASKIINNIDVNVDSERIFRKVNEQAVDNLIASAVPIQ
jgi:TP901 family phage tail tape measure protein